MTQEQTRTDLVMPDLTGRKLVSGELLLAQRSGEMDTVTVRTPVLATRRPAEVVRRVMSLPVVQRIAGLAPVRRSGAIAIVMLFPTLGLAGYAIGASGIVSQAMAALATITGGVVAVGVLVTVLRSMLHMPGCRCSKCGVRH